MFYKLYLQTEAGDVDTYVYEVTSNLILDSNGKPLVEKDAPTEYEPIHKVSPQTPGRKSDVEVLKIQLGLGCNYSCSYCLQSSELIDATKSLSSDTDKFLEELETWLYGSPKKIEFWGGEPLVYWSKIETLVPALRERYPDAIFSMVTNGSLLDDEKVDFIEKWDIHVGISHDGPAQKYRGPDPFSDPEKRRVVNSLFDRRSWKTSFNIVIHSKNCDFNAIHDWFKEKFPNAPLSLEGIIAVYDDYTLHSLGSFTHQEYKELADNIFMEIVVHKNRFSNLTQKMMNFIRSLKKTVPLEALSQKCGMDKENNIAVDLLGNVITCQNTGAKGKHKIGHVSQYQDIRLNTSTHFSFREECMHCPVLRLCRGSCMYLNEDYFSQSCWNEYYYNLGILKAALFILTGKLLIGVEGDIRRPEFSTKALKKNPDLAKLYQT